MRAFLITGVFISLFACRTEETKTTVDTNNAPVADAGADIKQSSDQPIMLDGGGSFDPDGDALVYNWSLNRVPAGSALADSESAFTINNSGNSSTSFIPDVSGTYIVDLVVDDAQGASSNVDSLIVTIEEGQMPIANAGADVEVMEQESVSLDGSSSFDPMGRDLSYSWTLSSKPAASALTNVASPSQSQTSFVPDVAGIYLVSLVVSNGVSESTPDVTMVKVSSADPQPPTANAGQDFTAEDCTQIPLVGSNSFDPNGDVLTYFWALQSKPSVSTATDANFSDREIADPTFFADQAGEYNVSLAVSDGQTWSSPHLIAITVEERAANSAPTINAGNPVTIDAGDATCQVSGYSYICDECDSVTVNLGVGASVTDPDGDVYTHVWNVIDGDATVTDPTSLTTMVVLEGAEPTEPNVCDSTTYELQLSVTDCPGAETTDSVTLTVNCCGIESSE